MNTYGKVINIYAQKPRKNPKYNILWYVNNSVFLLFIQWWQQLELSNSFIVCYSSTSWGKEQTEHKK